MEEKERYEIHIYDDICVDLYDNGVLDKSINDTYKLEELLNQQSKRIKELENENKQLKQQLAESENQCRECKHLNKKIELNIKNKLMTENCELQKQLAEKEKRCEICGSKMILGELGYYCNNDELHPIYQAPNEAKSDYEKITLLKQDYDAMVEREELLRQQLAEKEKEIEKLTEELDYKNYCNDFC